MKRPPSTYRSLIPFTTSAPVADAPLQDYLPLDSQYREFALQLDKFDHGLSSATPWGVYKPADLLLDDKSEAMPKTSIYRVTSGKLAPSVMEGLAMYTTAYRVYDVLVRLKGSAGCSSLPRPLRHKRQHGWIGKDSQWLNLAALSDLKQALKTFVDEGKTASKLSTNSQAEIASGSQTDASLRLAAEIAAVKKCKKMLVVIKNMAYVAFCISIMMKGYLQVPDHASEISLDKETMASKQVALLMKNAKRIRQALQQELLLNMKLIGNDTPVAIRALEDEVWDAILGIVDARYTSVSAHLHLQTVVNDFLGNNALDAGGNGFFGRSYPICYHKTMSVYTAFPEDPLPSHWPLPPASQAYILCKFLDEQGRCQDPSTGSDPVIGNGSHPRKTPPLDTSQSNSDSVEQLGPEIDPQNNKDHQAITNIGDRLRAPKKGTPAKMSVNVAKSATRKNPEREPSRLPLVKSAGGTKTIKPKNPKKYVSVLARTPNLEKEAIFVDLKDLAPKDQEEYLKIMKDIITFAKVEDSSVEAQADLEHGTTRSLQLGVLVEFIL
ncbi:hypothetical protein EST38_g4400 [Candolleomyces aberdarensis]|uniref:Uncharacterized protein n=1 Tax=Candolleomyces aberdarensis TaxID=2316362 RepID=A0A4Q2DN29_9AGAR|nr:hypothetical protein EST38_g4400 [Candolleomyces aberdarensis]